MSDTDADGLRVRIEHAFEGVPYPGDDNITAHLCPECREITEYFRGKGWRDHRVSDLRYHAAALSLFTPAAYHYYLPAFILADIEDPAAADIISDSILFGFTPTLTEDPTYQRARRQRLSPTQRAVVSEYIRYMAVRDELEPQEIALALRLLDGRQAV